MEGPQRRRTLWLLAAAALWPSAARAESTSWLSLGLGASRLELPSTTPIRMHMPIDVGVGLQPSLPVTVGVGARLMPYFGSGVDYGAYVRGASRGYVLGGFGLALDAGAYGRSFGTERGGLMGSLHLGIPWGLVVSGNFSRGFEGEQTFGATLGIDFLRLTVYRLAGEEQWPNVRPAWRP